MIRSGSFRIAIVLVALLVGTLSGIDTFTDHSLPTGEITPHPQITGDGGSTDSFDAHYGAKAPPRCNACYFNKLLSQTLIPDSGTVAAIPQTTEHWESHRVTFVHLQFNPEVDRGPPTAS